MLACGYGFTYLPRHFGYQSLNSGRNGPKKPEATILLADVGPDDGLTLQPLYASMDPGGLGRPWRDGGRLLWDDGNRGWYSGPTWLTARHLGKINMSAYDLSVKRVSTVRALTSPIWARYRPPFTIDCYEYNPQTRAYTCLLCATPGFPHYTFADSRMWWWTGPYPQP